MFGVQDRPVKSVVRLAFVIAIGFAVASGAACKRQIGDDCTTAAECDPNGTRSCDLSQPGGYCTVLGCDETTCSEEAVCIRFFPAKFLTQPCDPEQPSACAAEELCLPSGLCAPRSTERRACVKSCEGGDDCREGYECRMAGIRGSILLSATVGAKASFCAPRETN
jgi:hypothetical protein